MYSTKQDSMTISIQVHAWHKMTEASALLNSGATHNFIDKWAVKSLRLGTWVLPQPWMVHNINGTTNCAGTITHYCNLWVQQGHQLAKLGFFITNLGHNWIILGHPWFQEFNPSIDWTSNTLVRDSVILETAGYHTKWQQAPPKPMITSITPSILTSKTPPIDPSIPEYYQC